ncbi:MAG: cell wall-active antibiotics response protein [Bacteroidetes bacterium]|nr:cell wall-active antibiotics response protein [Bacteroidota bacterium]MBU1116216.1 cell wall-active antibiotics response protein [Bacteroidota bacterium]MBU1798586.1 cell wall-active antibiotics response protein [Bacteroidota bacterium]
MRNNDSKVIAGVLLILIGLFAFSGNLFGLPFHFTHYIFSIPGILMIVGVLILLNHNDSFLGLVFVGVGGFWFLSRYSDIPIKYYFYEYWPILLIIFGIYIIFKRKDNDHNSFKIGSEKSSTIDLDYIDDVSIFGNGNKSINSQSFKGGKVTVILGGTQLDLHQANLAEGTNSLEIVAIFGGVEVIVPRDWKVIVNATSIFGGVDDKRIINVNQVYESNKVLIIKGAVIFGGCSLKTY